MKQLNKCINLKMILGITSFLWIACTSENPEGCDKEISSTNFVPVHIASARIDMEVNTRIDTGTITTSGNKLILFRPAGGGWTAQNEVVYEYRVAEGWVPAATDTLFVDERPSTLYAVYDPQGLVTFTSGTTVTENKLLAQTYTEEQLWFYDNTQTAVVGSQAAAFYLLPAYARITLNITRHPTNYIDGDCHIGDVVLQQDADFVKAATMDIATATLVEEEKSAMGTCLQNMNVNLMPGGRNAEYDKLVPPQRLVNGLKITLEVDGKELSVIVPLPENYLKSGNHYYITLTVTNTGIIVSDVLMKEYTDGDTISSKDTSI
mgnify:CR=1 FL=1|jgi:hypothetical protein